MGFLRRLAAIVYDSLLVLAVCFLATAVVLPLNNGEAFQYDQYAYPVFLLTLCFFFFAWFWTHGGQTPGMKAWKVLLVSDEHPDISGVGWKQAGKRFIAALVSWMIFGAGFVAILIGKQKLAWHDRFSGSQLIFTG